MMTRATLLTCLAAATLFVGGCGTGATDSGPTAAGSGAPGASSGAAGSAPATPTPGPSPTSR